MLSALYQIGRAEGVSGLQRGLYPGSFWQFSNVSVRFGVYGFFQRVAGAADDASPLRRYLQSLGLAGVLSIAVAETVFWVLSFPTSELVYYIATGEWIDLFSQEGQVKFLAFTVGWGGIGGIIAQYRTVLTAAAMTPATMSDPTDRWFILSSISPPPPARPRSHDELLRR